MRVVQADANLGRVLHHPQQILRRQPYRGDKEPALPHAQDRWHVLDGRTDASAYAFGFKELNDRHGALESAPALQLGAVKIHWSGSDRMNIDRARADLSRDLAEQMNELTVRVRISRDVEKLTVERPN